MNTVVMGLQWGDEGKGKAIDYLANDYDVVVRYQGGHNAGHTIYFQDKKVVLHLLPSGILSPHTISVIANGVVVNPVQLVEEIEQIRNQGFQPDNLQLSSFCPVILPVHQELDIVFEDSRYVKIGTTRRGIGPAYEDLTGRRAVFVKDLLDKDIFYKKAKPLNDYYNQKIVSRGGKEVSIDSYIDTYIEMGKKLKPFVCNTLYSLNSYLKAKKRILLEGAQGVLLDINFGTYPFVTSSNPTVGGVCTGTGLSHKAIENVIGISKAYTTRVGGGPFPSELLDDEANFLREKGNEYGATTGRPRRVGWLDLVALKYAIMINGVDSIFLTKLDVLDEFDQIKVVTAYEDTKTGEQGIIFDPSFEYLENVKPVIKTFKGWKSNIGDIKQFESLPLEARQYIAYIEESVEVPVKYISVGTGRHQTIQK